MWFGALSPEIALAQQRYHAVGFTPFTVEQANELAKPSIPTPDGGRSCDPFYDVTGINNRGALIGAAHSLEHKLFIASVAGVTNEHAELVTDGKVLEIGAGSVASYATDINGRGQATGWVETNRIGHAFFVDRK